MKRGHGACAALLNLAAAEHMVWPSPLKFIGELRADARAFLEAARGGFTEANREREKKILGSKYSDSSPIQGQRRAARALLPQQAQPDTRSHARAAAR